MVGDILLNKFFKRNKNENPIDKILDNCNYLCATQIIEKQWAGAVIPNDLARLLTEFVTTPNKQTAHNLIKYDGRFLAVFELARHGGFTEFLMNKE